MTETSEDGFLGGVLRIRQPARGYRAGADAVMLAASCPAMAGQRVLELGCGAGVASLCLGWRVPGLHLAGLERQADYAALARENAAANDIALQVHLGDLAAMPAALRAESFDHVIANPPYFLNGTAARDKGRATARQEMTPLPIWLDAALRRLRPDGIITLIQRVERLPTIICSLQDRAGDMCVLPLSSRAGREAARVIVTARKGARGPLRLLNPLVIHSAPGHLRDGEDLGPTASAVLRGGAPLTPLFAKVP